MGSKSGIVVVSTDPWLDKLHGGSILDLFNSLSSLGHSVKVLLTSPSSLRINQKRLSILAYGSNRNIPVISYLSFLMRIFPYLLKNKPQVLIFDTSILPCFMVLRLLTKPIGLMLILSRPLKRHGLKTRLANLKFRASLLLGKYFTDAFTAISPFEAREFSALGRIPIKKIIVLPSPLGRPFYSISSDVPVDEQRVKLKLNSLVGRKVLLYQGFLDVRRGIRRVLKLFADLQKQSNLVLLLVGDGPARELVKGIIQERAATNIVLLDPVPYSRMPEYIKACDAGLVLFPNDSDWRYQTPTKLLEFLILRKPIIASDLAGIRWVVGNSSLVVYLKTLELAETCDFQTAVNHVLRLSTDNVRSDNLNSGILLKRFSSNSIAFRLSETIDSLVNQRGSKLQIE